MNSIGLTIETSEGVRSFETVEAYYAEVSQLNRHISASNLENTRAYFALGELLVKGHDQLVAEGDPRSRNHLMNDLGVHRQRGKRAVKYYKTLSDPETGAFSLEFYNTAKHQVAEAVARGEMNPRYDQHGDPSTSAIEQVIGIRGIGGKGSVGNQVVTTLQAGNGDFEDFEDESDPMGSILDGIEYEELDEECFEETEYSTDSSPSQSPLSGAHHFVASGPAGVAGDQLVIDFDLLAYEARMHKSLMVSVQKIKSGELEHAHAVGIKSQLEKLTSYLEGINSIEDDA